ncbi:MAG: SusC/RagA family TonB-linked outer membrane protein [Puia sp.]
MRKCFLGLLCFVLLSLCSFAQTTHIQGTVSDSSGSALGAVTITEAGTRRAVSTNADGGFSLQVEPGTVLLFSAVGYIPQRVAIGGRTDFHIRMQQDVQSLSEVVVTGLGVATSKKVTPIDVGTLSARDVAKSTLGSVEEALIGKIAGAQVQINSGSPGTGATIILRGLNSLGDSYPLIMVDGIEVSDLNGLDLGNVERIEVVKGAAAGMLYGAQGANGVIQVFTKKGLRGRKPQINFTTQASRGTILTGKNSLVASRHSFTTDGQGYLTSGGTRIAQDPTGAWPAPDFKDATLDPFLQNDQPYKEVTYDHLKQAYQPANTYNNSINISGGGEKSDYSFTLSRYDEQNVLSNAYKKTSVSANIGIELAKGLTFRNSLQTIFTSENLISGDADASIGATSTNRFGLLNSYPFIDFSKKDSTGHYIVSPISTDRQILNPLSEQQWRDRLLTSNRIIENASLNYKFPRFLEFDYKYGIEIWNTDQTNYYHNQSSALQSNVVFWGQSVDGSITDTYEKFTRQNSLLSAFLKTDFQNDFHWNIPIRTVTQITYDYRRTDDRNYLAEGSILPDYPPYNIGVASNHTSTDYYSTFITYGYLINQSIDYKEIVGISGGFRSDYSSAFGAGSKPFTFPRGTIYIRPTELFRAKVLPEWKLRAAYGEAGIQPAPYDRQPTLAVAQLGNVSTISNPFQIPNAGLRVQQSKELELGTDVTLHVGSKNWLPQVNFSFTYWVHKNTDIIQPADVPPSSGYTKKLDNLTSIDSRGWDFSLDAHVVSSPVIDWQFGFRLGTAKSIATKIANGADLVNGIFTVRQGQELGLFSFQYPVSRLDQLQQDGKTPYIPTADRGNFQVVDGVVTDTATKQVLMSNATDQKSAGNAYPDFTASFINTFTILKNIVFSFQWDWYHGNKIYNTTRQWLYRDRLSADYDRPVTIDGQTGAYVAFYNSLYNNVSPSTWYVEDGSFLRLRDVSLTYNISAALHLKWAKQVSLTVSGRNLITVTRYSGLDPEATTTADSQGNLAGVPASGAGVSKGSLGFPQYTGAIKGADYFSVPNLKSYQLSLRVGF